MTDRTYLNRRAAQQANLASKAISRRAAAAHDAMAAAYFSQLAKLAELDELRLGEQRPLNSDGTECRRTRSDVIGARLSRVSGFHPFLPVPR
jgi:hypothetical protein